MFGNKNDRLDYHDRELTAIRDELRLLKKIIKIIIKSTEHKELKNLLKY